MAAVRCQHVYKESLHPAPSAGFSAFFNFFFYFIYFQPGYFPSCSRGAAVAAAVRSTEPGSAFGRQTRAFLQNPERPLGTVIPSVRVSSGGLGGRLEWGKSFILTFFLPPLPRVS